MAVSWSNYASWTWADSSHQIIDHLTTEMVSTCLGRELGALQVRNVFCPDSLISLEMKEMKTCVVPRVLQTHSPAPHHPRGNTWLVLVRCTWDCPASSLDQSVLWWASPCPFKHTTHTHTHTHTHTTFNFISHLILHNVHNPTYWYRSCHTSVAG